ncbi:MAG: nicotinate (nicotinamide) nucleotide adenylyltransferase [Oligosphaeraceae bacterium]|nr:nicotinate (nicotinamide) nucleotide adenylyltransferase [Oligosphaeraceae bacterium]
MYENDIFPAGPEAELPDQPKVPEMPPLPQAFRLGVLGGTFDPPHLGHSELAAEILRQELCDEIMFIPTGIPPHKDHEALTTAQQRLEMLKLLIQCNPKFSYSNIEMNRSDRESYTFDTMRMLRSIFPDQQLYFIMGMDCLHHLHTWHRATELVQLCDFIVYPRPGMRAPFYNELLGRFGDKASRKLLDSIIEAEDLPLWDISSSDLRKARRAGGDLGNYLLPAVWNYVQEKRLYID